MLNLHNRLK